MKFDRKSLLLYAVTDQSWTSETTLKEQVEEALQAGITFLQLREKNKTEEEMLQEALEIKEMAKSYQVPFIINDNVNVALKCDADGVHIGQDDMSVKEARKILGVDKILGVSVQTAKQAKQAQEEGADYLGVGAIFATATKTNAKELSLEILKEIYQAVTIPVVAIGGIQKENIKQLKDTGIQGVAVVSAIFASKEIDRAVKDLLIQVKDVVNE